MSFVLLDVNGVGSPDEFQDMLMKAFDFPLFYGKNWDAFWDSITGLIEMPDKIEIDGWHRLLQRLPEDAQMLLTCLDEYNRQIDLKKIELILK